MSPETASNGPLSGGDGGGGLPRAEPACCQRAPAASASPAFQALLLLVLYGAGILHWLYFFSGATLCLGDWSLTLDFQSVLREALARAEIPYMMNLGDHYSNQFLGLPEVPLSPQYLLLPFFSNWAFNLFNACFLYTAGFGGLLLLRRQFGLSLLPFSFLYLLFNFNGYLVARLGAGHSMWLGYYFLPMFFLCLFQLAEAADPRKPAVGMTLVLVLIELQGSFHVYVWCLLYLVLVALFNPRLIKPLAFVCIWSGLLCVFRFLPAAVTFWGKNLAFLTGFPSFLTLLDGLTTIKDLHSGIPGEFNSLGWWEFDCYVDTIGLGLLLYFGVFQWLRSDSSASAAYRALFLPGVVVVLLSLGPAFGVLQNLPVPLIASQRIASRLIVIPLALIIVAASVFMQEFLDKTKAPHQSRLFLLLSLVFLAKNLYEHSLVNRILNGEALVNSPDGGIGRTFAAMTPLPTEDFRVALYVTTVKVSAVLALLSCAVFVGWVLRSRARTPWNPCGCVQNPGKSTP